MHVFEQHGAVAASVACRFVLRRRSAIGCGSSDACVRAASSSGSVCCLQVRAETKKRKAPAPVIPRALPLLQPGSADLIKNFSKCLYVSVLFASRHDLCDNREMVGHEALTLSPRTTTLLKRG